MAATKSKSKSASASRSGKLSKHKSPSTRRAKARGQSSSLTKKARGRNGTRIRLPGLKISTHRSGQRIRTPGMKISMRRGRGVNLTKKSKGRKRQSGGNPSGKDNFKLTPDYYNVMNCIRQQNSELANALETFITQELKSKVENMKNMYGNAILWSQIRLKIDSTVHSHSQIKFHILYNYKYKSKPTDCFGENQNCNKTAYTYTKDGILSNIVENPNESFMGVNMGDTNYFSAIIATYPDPIYNDPVKLGQNPELEEAGLYTNGTLKVHFSNMDIYKHTLTRTPVTSNSGDGKPKIAFIFDFDQTINIKHTRGVNFTPSQLDLPETFQKSKVSNQLQKMADDGLVFINSRGLRSKLIQLFKKENHIPSETLRPFKLSEDHIYAAHDTGKNIEATYAKAPIRDNTWHIIKKQYNENIIKRLVNEQKFTNNDYVMFFDDSDENTKEVLNLNLGSNYPTVIGVTQCNTPSQNTMCAKNTGLIVEKLLNNQMKTIDELKNIADEVKSNNTYKTYPENTESGMSASIRVYVKPSEKQAANNFTNAERRPSKYGGPGKYGNNRNLGIFSIAPPSSSNPSTGSNFRRNNTARQAIKKRPKLTGYRALKATIQESMNPNNLKAAQNAEQELLYEKNPQTSNA